MRQVAVIGGGIAGLTCAWDLQRAGVDVTVFEREESVGGRMRTRSRDGLAFDLGANFLVGAYRQVTEMARQLGIGLHCVSPVRHTVRQGGRWRRMNLSGAGHQLKLEALSPGDILKLLALLARGTGRELDFFDLSRGPLPPDDAYALACREVGRTFADYVVDPFTSCMMFSRASEHSALTLQALLSMLADTRFDFSILYADGDMQALPEALACQVPVQRGCPVSSLSHGAGGWLLTAGGTREVYERVVVATTAGAAAALLSDGPAPHRELVRATRYAPTINVAFRVPCRALGRTHCFYVPYSESTLISEFTNEALKGEDTTRDGWSLVNVGLHEAAGRALLAAEEDTIFALVRHELERLQPGLQPQAYDLQRWPEALPKYSRDHIARVRDFQTKGQGVEGVYLCGDYMNAPWVEGASRSGRTVARCILSELI